MSADKTEFVTQLSTPDGVEAQRPWKPGRDA